MCTSSVCKLAEGEEVQEGGAQKGQEMVLEKCATCRSVSCGSLCGRIIGVGINFWLGGGHLAAVGRPAGSEASSAARGVQGAYSPIKFRDFRVSETHSDAF